MGRLFLYSDQIAESPGNQRLDELLFSDKQRETIKIGYIPSTEDKDKKYFHIKAQYYLDYGIRDVLFFDLYSEFDSLKIAELLKCDIIHLSAGNPISFREALKERRMDRVLKSYFEQGGTIVGVSGGAVQLGKSANLYQLFSEGSVKGDLTTLNCGDFEFLPHYNRWDTPFKDKVQTYANETNTTIYAVNDGDGLIVEKGNIQMIGEVVVIEGEVGL